MKICSHIGFCAALSIVTVFMCLSLNAAGQDAPVRKTGKWSGDFSLNGGANLERHDDDMMEGTPFFTNMNGGASAKIGYTSRKFYINGTVSGNSDNKATTRQGITANLDIGGKQGSDTLVKSNVEESEALTKSLRLDGGLNAGWRFDERNKLDVSYNFSMMRDTPQKTVMFMSFDTDMAIDTLSINNLSMKVSSEAAVNRKTDHSFGLKYLHTFDKPGRVLEATADASAGFTENSNEYSIITSTIAGGTKTVDLQLKGLVNTYQDDAAVVNVRYTDKQFAGIQNLDVDFLFKMDFKADIDHLTETEFVDSVYVESKSEGFRNHEYKPAPGFHLTYSGTKFGADISYTPQFFFYRISSDSESGYLTTGATSHFIDVNGSYKLQTGHAFNLVYKRAETRPDYLRLCPIKRAGSSSNETIEGNPDLMPSVRNKLSFLHNYVHGRFSSSFEAGLMHEKRKITQLLVFHKDPVTGQETGRTRTWHNAEDGYTANAGASMSWKGRVIMADLSANLNYFYGIKENGSDVRTSDWSCKGSISYPMKTWLFNASFNYQSKIIRQYSSMTEIIGLNLKVEKKFGRFGVILEGRNLLDRNVIVFTESDDGLQGRYEDIDNNNRLVIFGVKYTF